MGDSEKAILERWKTEQARIRSELTFSDFAASFTVSSTSPGAPQPSPTALQDEYDTPVVHLDRPEDVAVEHLRYVGGVDISFVPSPTSPSPGSLDGERLQTGVATVVILAFPSLVLVRTLSRRIVLEEPYISSFLAFREAPPLLELMRALKDDLGREGRLDMWPQVLFVDGNGRLHERECGLACVLGLELGIPTIGISKKPYVFSSSPESDESPAHWRSTPRSLGDALKTHLVARGSWLGLFPPPSRRSDRSVDDSNKSSTPAQESSPYLGAALIPSASSRTAVFVSAGHLVSLETCVRLTVLCSKTKIPEPVRRADLEGREQVRRWVKEMKRAEDHSQRVEA